MRNHEFGHTRVRFKDKKQKSTFSIHIWGGSGGDQTLKTLNFGGKLSFILSFIFSLSASATQGFFFRFCDVAEVAIISNVIQPNLATSTNMEVGKNKNHWLLTKINNKNLAIGRIYFRSLANLGHFFHGKSFLQVEIIFFRQGFGENSPIKETLQCKIYFHCSYLYNYYDYSRTLCIKCWVSAFHTEI